MDPNTLPFYLSASGLSFFLGLLLFWFRRFLSGSAVTLGATSAFGIMGAAFLVAGYAAGLPRWASVIGSNMLLLAGCVLFHTSLTATLLRQTQKFDRFGWGVVATTVIPFAYWGLIEPNGHYRSAVFSLAVVAINGRTAVMLLRAAWRRIAVLATGFLAALFGTATLWMLVRGLWMLANPAPDIQRGTNPTTWSTVLGYMVLVSSVAAAIAWIEIAGLKRQQPADSMPPRGDLALRGKLVLLSGIVAVFLAGTAIGVYGHYQSLRAEESGRATRAAAIANDAFIAHTRQIVGHADHLLRAVRGYYQTTRSVEATQRFIAGIDIDNTPYENIYLIDADGWPLLPREAAKLRRNASDREYAVFHRATADDVLYVGSTDRGRLTGEYYFRISRRIGMPDGSFGGHVAITIRPDALAELYRQHNEGADNVASLVGVNDRRIRARHPLPDSVAYEHPIDSPLWDALASAPTGEYRNVSTVDGIPRQFVYKRIENLPLVMVTGFSDADVADRVTQRFRLVALAALSACGFVAMLAMILALSLRRQEAQENLAVHLQSANEEQDKFLSMLSHELKTPLSVIRMSLADDSAASRARAIRNVGDIDAIVERCLQTDRIEHGRIEASPTHFDPAALIRDLVANHAESARLRLAMDALPEGRTDVQLLNIILGNLIDNALKYGAAGSAIEISASAEARHGDAGVRIAVGNPPGPAGMPDPDRVFRKFYRAPGAHSKTGSGLGLHIAESLARKLGGELAYRPSDDRVKFELWIPL